MVVDASRTGFLYRGELDDWIKHHPVRTRKVLLREPEICRECGEVFQSLYPLRRCIDHDRLERV